MSPKYSQTDRIILTRNIGNEILRRINTGEEFYTTFTQARHTLLGNINKTSMKEVSPRLLIDIFKELEREAKISRTLNSKSIDKFYLALFGNYPNLKDLQKSLKTNEEKESQSSNPTRIYIDDTDSNGIFKKILSKNNNSKQIFLIGTHYTTIIRGQGYRLMNDCLHRGLSFQFVMMNPYSPHLKDVAAIKIKDYKDVLHECKQGIIKLITLLYMIKQRSDDPEIQLSRQDLRKVFKISFFDEPSFFEGFFVEPMDIGTLHYVIPYVPHVYYSYYPKIEGIISSDTRREDQVVVKYFESAKAIYSKSTPLSELEKKDELLDSVNAVEEIKEMRKNGLPSDFNVFDYFDT